MTTSGNEATGKLGSEKPFADGLFRANPDYEFVFLDNLSATDQEAFGSLRSDKNFYGLLRPRRNQPGLTIKALCRKTADVFTSLRRPGKIPSTLATDNASVRRMVYDGILQIHQGEDWNSGFAAWLQDVSFRQARSNNPSTPFDQTGETLAELSIRALRHAESLRVTNIIELSDTLYRYNSLPFTTQWARRIPDSETLIELLGIQSGGSLRPELDRDWSPVPNKEKNDDAWLSWESRGLAVTARTTSCYKLYLSPHPAHLREAFQVFVPAITTAGAHNFKVGGNVRDVLRPDKLVAYFQERAALDQAASLITKDLAGCPAQGVPFTAEFNSGALISWASDPPVQESDPLWIRRQSWRGWICSHLASALAIAKNHKESDPRTDRSSWRFALDRVRLEGVDTSTWTLSTMWESTPAFQDPTFQ